MPDPQYGSIELQTPTEHLAQVDDASRREDTGREAVQREEATLNAADPSDTLDFSILGSFDATLPTFFSDDTWYDFGQL